MAISTRCARASLFRRALFALVSMRLFLDVFEFHFYRFSRSTSHAAITKPNGTIFIASTFWNSEAVLRDYWNDAILDLADRLGPSNVFVSVYESGSWDNSKGVLRELGEKLKTRGIRHQIVLDETTHADEISTELGAEGWIDTPRNKRERRRIPYLSKVRNLSLEPMKELAQEGVLVDKILFLNDVVFTTNDVLELIHTNEGRYAAACSLDFSRPPDFYDTFALRDKEGHEAMMSTWPYFRSKISRQALQKGLPVPVSSCWNGMVIMKAEPFLKENSPLRFRGIPDSLAEMHLEGSECCLIYEDNPLLKENGVFMNPFVKVGYNKEAYDTVNGFQMTLINYLWSTTENRLRRWFTTDWLKTMVVSRRLTSWQKTHPTADKVGAHCLINEMQVLLADGWAHV